MLLKAIKQNSSLFEAVALSVVEDLLQHQPVNEMGVFMMEKGRS